MFFFSSQLCAVPAFHAMHPLHTQGSHGVKSKV